MKLTEYFSTFMTDVINLNDTRLKLLEDSVNTLQDTIRAADWKPKVRLFFPQGSWAHKTIIKPIEDNPFDADLLVFVDPVEGWDAKEYLSTLRSVFTNHGTYKDKVTRSSHCVTIKYASERNVDIAPCIVNREGSTRLEVCNFDRNHFERTEPQQYTDWLIKRNSWTGGNYLRKVTRLLKYLRDIKTTFTCPSVLLTTLLGMQISAVDEFNSTEFGDLPTALRTIVRRLDGWLAARPKQAGHLQSNPSIGSNKRPMG